jgi:hypothetical protein
VNSKSTDPSYSVAEMLDLNRQYETYGALLFCPATHEHRHDEFTCSIDSGQVTGSCVTCGREIILVPTVDTAPLQMPGKSDVRLRQGELLLQLRVGLEAMRLEMCRSREKRAALREEVAINRKRTAEARGAACEQAAAIAELSQTMWR